MAADGAGPGWALPALDLVVVVSGGVVAVTVAGVAWSYLRVGGVHPSYVREAQFLAGLAVLVAWTVRNWRGRRPGQAAGDEGGTTPSRATAWRMGAYDRLGRGPPATAGDAAGTDAALLALGVVLLVLSLGGEVLGVPPG